MDQDATWYGDRPRPRRLCVRWEPSSPLPSAKGAQPRSFRPMSVVGGQTAGWSKMPLGVEVGLGPGNFALDEDPVPPEKSTAPTQFLAHVYCGQTAGWMKTPLGAEVDLGPGHIVLGGDPAAPTKVAQQSFRPMSILATVAHLKYC